MSIVPEEGSILSNATNTNNDTNGPIQDYKTHTGNTNVNNRMLCYECWPIFFIYIYNILRKR